MTHDELLAEIKSRVLHPAQDITNPITWEHKAKLADALRAVVELHKPDEDGVCKQCNGECWGCGEWGCRFKCDCDCHPKYPCPTIQIIEKEMK